MRFLAVGLMTHPETWKALEREVAKKLGGKRIPCSGSGEIKGDVLHRKLYIECKYRDKFPSLNKMIDTWLRDSIEEAERENKIPILAIKRKGKGQIFILMRIEDLRTLL
jgi:hypothetical protein